MKIHIAYDLLSTFTFRLIQKTIIFALIGIVVSSFGAQKTRAIDSYVFKFYLDPALVGNMAVAKTNLAKYVVDLNTILAKNTTKKLVFNPETDIILTTEEPQTNYAIPPLPNLDFEIWAHAVATTAAFSYDGYTSVDISGAGVLAGLKWTRIYDPDILVAGTNQMKDYWTQIDHMLHEIAHVFNAGISEYYSLATVNDATLVSPIVNISLTKNGAKDSFWGDKVNFFGDPLLGSAYDNPRIGNPVSRTDLLVKTLYSDLTSAIMNGPYRNSVPTTDMSDLQIKLVDSETKLPIKDAEVKIWNIVGGNDAGVPTQLYNLSSDQAGFAHFAWGGIDKPHSSSNNMRLLKIYKDGYHPIVKYISVFDTEIQKILLGNTTFLLTLPVTPLIQHISISSTPLYDGWILESTETSNTGGSLNSSNTTFILGDDIAKKQYKSILHFATASLPDNASINDVRLDIKFNSFVGSNPLLSFGGIKGDISKTNFGSASLEISDFNKLASAVNIFQPFSNWTKTADNIYQAPMKSTGIAKINLVGSTQIRLYFAIDDNNNTVADYVRFNSGEAAVGKPTLIITYQTP